MDENLEKFAGEVEKSLERRTFVKLVLSNYKGPERQLQKISVRPVETKKGERLMFQWRFETRDITKNHSFEEAVDEIRGLLRSGFRNAHLFATEQDVQFEIGKRRSRLMSGRPTFTDRPSTGHDREKTRLIDPNAFYLKALGISADDGRIKARQQDKWRQINKFVEILASLVDASPLRDKKELRIVDMGSGKGYLTFAAYDYFTNVSGLTVSMTGVEARPELVETCSHIAEAGGFGGLKFVQGNIADLDPGEVDILIALHACDTATDDALYRGVAADASIIVAAPCCHQEVRRQMKPPELLAGVLKHGVMLERMAETLTDGLRALLLERSGYSTKLFEFVPSEHTPKNNMLAATRRSAGDAESAFRQIEDLKSFFAITEQRLDTLLKS